jgi:hypothetical protein
VASVRSFKGNALAWRPPVLPADLRAPHSHPMKAHILAGVRAVIHGGQCLTSTNRNHKQIKLSLSTNRTLTLEIWEKLTPSNGGELEEGLLGQLGMDTGRRSLQIWPPPMDL